jgi:hypothetical protein
MPEFKRGHGDMGAAGTDALVAASERRGRIASRAGARLGLQRAQALFALSALVTVTT